MDWEQRLIQNPVKPLRWSVLQKLFTGFFRRRLHLRWKPLPVFARRSIFDGWYCPEYASGVWKYTLRKIGTFSRTSRSIIYKTVCKHLKSIRYHKDYRRDFYRKFADLFIPLKVVRKPRSVPLNSCSVFSSCKIHKKLPLPEPLFWLILQAVSL